MVKTKKKIKNSVTIKDVPYYHDAIAICSCGARFSIGSTQKEIHVEICSACHPFYTGNQKLIDTSGRVDKFKNRIKKQQDILSKLSKNKKPSENTKKKEGVK